MVVTKLWDSSGLTCNGGGYEGDIYINGSSEEIGLLLEELEIAKPAYIFKHFSELASEVLYLKSILLLSGYPIKIWMPSLIEYEKFRKLRILFGINNYGDLVIDYGQYATNLENKLNNYRERKTPYLLPVHFSNGCGGGEKNTVKIVQEPKNGRIFLIPAFNYELCRVQDIKPEDTENCSGWVESTQDTPLYRVGNYRYQATWSDGSIRKGILNFDYVEEGQIITIKKL